MDKLLNDIIRQECLIFFRGGMILENGSGVGVMNYLSNCASTENQEIIVKESLNKMTLIDILTLTARITAWSETSSEHKRSLMHHLMTRIEFESLTQKINDMNDKFNVLIDALTLIDQRVTKS